MGQIYVIDRDVLFTGGAFAFQWFRPAEGAYKSIPNTIAEKAFPMERADAETNPKYKQPIPYVIVMRENGDVFVYNRPANGTETRLAGARSIGIGGHIDCGIDDDAVDIIGAAAKREMSEELWIFQENIIELNNIGFINDDMDDVGSVHFGIVYVARIMDDASIACNPEEIINGEFMPIAEVSLSPNLENWSRIVIDAMMQVGK